MAERSCPAGPHRCQVGLRAAGGHQLDKNWTRTGQELDMKWTPTAGHWLRSVRQTVCGARQTVCGGKSARFLLAGRLLGVQTNTNRRPFNASFGTKPIGHFGPKSRPLLLVHWNWKQQTEANKTTFGSALASTFATNKQLFHSIHAELPSASLSLHKEQNKDALFFSLSLSHLEQLFANCESQFIVTLSSVHPRPLQTFCAKTSLRPHTTTSSHWPQVAAAKEVETSSAL